MYQNKIVEEDYEDELESVKDNIILEKQNQYLERMRAEEVAHYMMLWLKYYRCENTSYHLLARSILQEIFPITKEREKRIIKKSKQILLEKYQIRMVSNNPMILSSPIPFEEIKENEELE